jgi:hypothetical protein
MLGFDRLLEAAVQDDRRAVGKPVRHRDLGVDPADLLRNGEAVERRRRRRHRENPAQVSCTRPGSVRGSDATPPPGPRSSTSADTPAAASRAHKAVVAAADDDHPCAVLGVPHRFRAPPLGVDLMRAPGSG